MTFQSNAAFAALLGALTTALSVASPPATAQTTAERL